MEGQEVWVVLVKWVSILVEIEMKNRISLEIEQKSNRVDDRIIQGKRVTYVEF